jgi:hypothetical protein
MKLGTENKRTTIIAVVLGVLAIAAFARMIGTFGSTAPATPPPTTAAANSPTAATNAALAAATQPNAPTTSRTTGTRQRQRSNSQRDKRVTGAVITQSLDPRLNLALLEQSEKVTYSGTGRNIFKMEEEPPPMPTAVAPATIAKAPRTQPTMPPGPPPIPLKFYGWASKPGETRSVFLSSGGGDVFVAREGEIIDRRYKIVRIQPNTVEVEDMLTNNRQNLPLSQG